MGHETRLSRVDEVTRTATRIGEKAAFDTGTLRFLLGRGGEPVVLNADGEPDGQYRNAVELSRQMVEAARSERFGDSFCKLTGRLHRVHPGALPTDAHRIAFLVNVYNALVLDAVRAFGIRESIRERTGFFHTAAYDIGGQVFSLYQLEHGLLLGNRSIHPRLEPPFGHGDEPLGYAPASVDPRVHFALNCATKSCPPIASYDEKELDAQLDMATRAFANSREGLDDDGKTLTLSPIFLMHEQDFGGRDHLGEWLARYVDDPGVRRRLIDGDFDFGEYDWSLAARERSA